MFSCYSSLRTSTIYSGRPSSASFSSSINYSFAFGLFGRFRLISSCLNEWRSLSLLLSLSCSLFLDKLIELNWERSLTLLPCILDSSLDYSSTSDRFDSRILHHSITILETSVTKWRFLGSFMRSTSDVVPKKLLKGQKRRTVRSFWLSKAVADWSTGTGCMLMWPRASLRALYCRFDRMRNFSLAICSRVSQFSSSLCLDGHSICYWRKAYTIYSSLP